MQHAGKVGPMVVGVAILLSAIGVGVMRPPLQAAKGNASPKVEPLKLSEDEWRERLTPQQFAVLRKEDTERAGTSPLNSEKAKGMYTCAGCGAELFPSDTKFDSGTGWPSYYAPSSPEAVSEHVDKSWFSTRTEVRCAKCDGHMGPVYSDGPDPTGLRYCMNGAALKFDPKKAYE
jgi:peptide-methionine (R)-S-oxide reductase